MAGMIRPLLLDPPPDDLRMHEPDSRTCALLTNSACGCQVLCDADQEPDRRLTVGYVSPDLFTHSVSYFAEAPLRHHCKDAVRLIVYNCVPKVLADADKHALLHLANSATAASSEDS